MFLTSLKQTCNEYLIKFSENQSAPKLENTSVENRRTSPCSPRAPNLLHVLPSRMVGWNDLCTPDPQPVTYHLKNGITKFSNSFGHKQWFTQSLLCLFALHFITLHCIGLPGVALYCAALHCLTWCCTDNTWYCIVLPGVARYYLYYLVLR